jgi:hypothetical protein
MTPNILIAQDPGFGNPQLEIVQAFLYMVDINMMEALERLAFSSKQCVVFHGNGVPMCCNEGNYHKVFLTVTSDFWCQWVYQFAHEYCHHLINDTLSGEWSSFLWFEESLCEVSSMYNLHRMESFCLAIGQERYAPDVHQYLNDLLAPNPSGIKLDANGGWYQEHASLLSEDSGYKRELYKTIAALLFPLFLENPHLWKILLHIDDIHSWNSLDALFDHLQSKADDSYADSLRKMRVVFS